MLCPHRGIAVRAAEPRGCGILARVSTRAYEPYDVPGYLGALRREGELLAAAAERAGMSAGVPSCPDWAVRDLLKHTGYVHRWAAGFVTRRLTRPVGAASEAEILGQGPGDAGLPGWFREGHAALVRALDQAAPDLDCWAFLAAPSPRAFWARRQAHETAIHRADAEQAAATAAGTADGPAAGTADGPAAGTADGPAAGTADGPAGGSAGLACEPAFEPAFAADGVDELIMGFLARNIRRGGWPGLDGSLAIHAADGVDGGADWLVRGGSEAPGVSRGTGPADCDVTGAAGDLYLTLWNRRPPEGLQVDGDPGILAAFSRALQITW
jgi:uncharacterized protein (TIGR03083 family)